MVTRELTPTDQSSSAETSEGAPTPPETGTPVKEVSSQEEFDEVVEDNHQFNTYSFDEKDPDAEDGEGGYTPPPFQDPDSKDDSGSGSGSGGDSSSGSGSGSGDGSGGGTAVGS